MELRKCECGAWHRCRGDWCKACIEGGKLRALKPVVYAEQDELAVLDKAREMEMRGLVEWRVVDTAVGLRFFADGALFDIEGLDFYLAERLRGGRNNQTR